MPSRAWFAAIVIGVAISFDASALQVPPEDRVEDAPAEHQPTQRPAEQPEPVAPAVEPAEPTETEHAPDPVKDRDGGADNSLFGGDGLAQWVMAFTGVFALLLSAWAVWLLSHTLKATRDAVAAADSAVEVTRELGEAQIRAYLFCRSAKYRVSKTQVGATLDVGNAGQSPAREVVIAGTMTMHDVGGRPSMPRVLAYVSSSQVQVACQPIPASGNTVEEIIFFWEYNFPIEESEDVESKKFVFQGGNEIWLDLIVSWSDVFKKRHSLPVELRAIVGPSPNNPRKKRSTTGKLEFRMADTHPGDEWTREVNGNQTDDG